MTRLNCGQRRRLSLLRPTSRRAHNTRAPGVLPITDCARRQGAVPHDDEEGLALKNLPCGGQQGVVSVQVAVQITHTPGGADIPVCPRSRADRNVCPTVPLPRPLRQGRKGTGTDSPCRTGTLRHNPSPAPSLRSGEGKQRKNPSQNGEGEEDQTFPLLLPFSASGRGPGRGVVSGSSQSGVPLPGHDCRTPRGVDSFQADTA